MYFTDFLILSPKGLFEDSVNPPDPSVLHWVTAISNLPIDQFIDNRPRSDQCYNDETVIWTLMWSADVSLFTQTLGLIVGLHPADWSITHNSHSSQRFSQAVAFLLYMSGRF